MIFVIFKLSEIVNSLLASAKKPNIRKNRKLVMTKNKMTLHINFQGEKNKKSLFLD